MNENKAAARSSVAENLRGQGLGVDKTILLVDDTETILLFEQMILRGAGFKLVIARDGLQAMELVRKHSPDLILLDIMMPRMSGIDVCQKLRSSPATKEIPIIMVTTLGQPEMVEKAFEAGCNDYLTKPINKMELVTKIHVHLR